MHPAYSVILFTTASGAGYGLLFWLSLYESLGWYNVARWEFIGGLVLALALITVGLLASTFHLGHPERAWRAFSQWRSSWLSREGVAAVFTYIPAVLLGGIWLFAPDAPIAKIFAVLAALGALITVYCTGMIYASLRTVPEWNQGIVPLVYLVLALMTGGILLIGILGIVGHFTHILTLFSLVTLLIGTILKLSYWKKIDTHTPEYTTEMATGLGNFGKVRSLEPPHTRPNFVMREMGYQVARKHALKLRKWVLVCLFAIPALLLIGGFVISSLAALLYPLAILSAGIGIVAERWLFFAEAKHVSMLYYPQ